MKMISKEKVNHIANLAKLDIKDGEMEIYQKQLTDILTEIDKILKYIDMHITEPLNAEIIAENCFVSKSWLSHNFKEYLGISLKKYINQKKILIIEQLIPTGISITRLTEEYSYNNYTTFFKQYKQYLNKKPNSNKIKMNNLK